jgi:hypothetical protein
MLSVKESLGPESKSNMDMEMRADCGSVIEVSICKHSYLSRFSSRAWSLHSISSVTVTPKQQQPRAKHAVRSADVRLPSSHRAQFVVVQHEGIVETRKPTSVSTATFT